MQTRDNVVTAGTATPMPEHLHWNTELPPLSAFTSTKDIRYHPLFMGQISRFLWKLMMLTVTRTGRWFLVSTLLVAVPASISLDVQPYVLFCYAFGLWLTAVLFHIFYRPRVKIDAKHADRICVGETLPVDVEVTQTGRHAGADLTLLPHGLPIPVDAVPETGVRLPPIASGSKALVRLGLRCKKRGIYKLNGYRVETDFPFGLIRSYRVHYAPQSLMVYPSFHPLARLTIPTGRRYHPGGVALASNLGESFEFLGNREYQEGDNIRDIDWRATARLSKPIIREYREEYFLRVGVVLDTTFPVGGVAPPSRWGELRKGSLAQFPQTNAAHAGHQRPYSATADDFERAVSMAAAVSDYMSRQDYIVDLFAAGPNLYHLTAGRSLAYLDQILEILACVDASPQEPFEVLEPAILENLSKITTVICIFLDWNPSRQAFVDRLAQSGAGVKVIIVRDGPCTDDPSAAIGTTEHVPVIGSVEFGQGVEEL
jgi:uncharacterized protein (DUF58 family)